jgi:F0F1-type ATP synthase membrane subunit b/b'
MNKIVMLISSLFFFLAVIFFSQRDFPLQEIFLRSFAVFISIALLLSVIVIVFIKSINKASLKRSKEILDNTAGIRNNE